MRPTRIAPPAAQIITLAQAKSQARIDYSDQDSLTDQHVSAAIAYLDGYGGVLGRCMVEQTWRVPFSRFFRVLPMPFPDAISVEVKYKDDAGDEQTLSAAMYEVIEGHGGSEVHIHASTLPAVHSDSVQPVWVEGAFGYGDVPDVPASLKQAALMLAAHFEMQREATGDAKVIPFGVADLIAPHRFSQI